MTGLSNNVNEATMMTGLSYNVNEATMMTGFNPVIIIA